MDTVSDALTRIKNGYMASKPEIILPYSKLLMAICEVLKKQGYIADYQLTKVTEKSHFNQIKVSLRYEGRKAAVTEITRVSKPGLRVYKGKNALPTVLNGLGIAIVSTPKGVMTDKQARKEGLGGEVIALVW